MQKIETKTIKVKEIKHIFYCDNCKQKIGEDTENYEGSYENLGEFRASVYIFKMSFEINLNLCDKCQEQCKKEISDGLTNIGFIRS